MSDASANVLSRPKLKLRFGNRGSGKPGWKQQLANSDLPVEIQDTIRIVVLKTRLWRFEKAEVTADLISHFQDGYQRGMAFSQLVKDFGDPQVTATLIRRSKLRSRPIMMKIFKGLGIGAGILTASYLAILAYFHLGKPDPKIDFVVDWNRPVADVEDEDKAWPLYRPVWTKYAFCEGGGVNLEELYVTTDEPHPIVQGNAQRLILPTDEAWPEAVAAIEKYDELLDVFRIGAKLPSLGIELHVDARDYSDEDFAAMFPHYASKDDWSFEINWALEADENTLKLMHRSLVGILLPHVQSFRKAARLFHVDTRLAVVENDTERATQNIETVIGLSGQAAEGNCLVCSLVGFAVLEIGFSQLEEILVNDPEFFSESELTRIQIAVEQVPMRNWIHYEGERAMIHDLIQRIYTDDGNGDGRMTADGVRLLELVSRMWVISGDGESTLEYLLHNARPVIAPTSLFLCASRKETAEKCDELIDLLIADLEVPAWQAKDLGIEEFLKANPIKFKLLSDIFPASASIRNEMDCKIGRQEAVIAAIAIHRYHKQYGEWPKSYEEVAPEFVVEFPIDQVDGSLLKFTYQDDELLVYSVGRDLDDDGGADHGSSYNGAFTPQDRNRFVFGPSPAYEGDWILWPQNNWKVF